MTSTDDNLNQSTVCLKGVVGQCDVFNDLTAAMKRVAKLEAELEAERDQWKAHAKAVERLVIDAYNGDLDLPCTACEHFPCGLDCRTPGYFKFSFNDAYFDVTPEPEAAE